MIKLNSVQQKHLESLRWLFLDGGHGTGRSFLIALVLIEKAVSKHNTWIDVFDHAGTRRMALNDTIKLIVKVFNETGYRVDYSLMISHHRKQFKVVKNKCDHCN